jgi:hypothetical protein
MRLNLHQFRCADKSNGNEKGKTKGFAKIKKWLKELYMKQVDVCTNKKTRKPLFGKPANLFLTYA